MKVRQILAAAAAILLCDAAFAGISRSLPVPTLGDAGLVMLAVGLVGAGVATLRRSRTGSRSQDR